MDKSICTPRSGSCNQLRQSLLQTPSSSTSLQIYFFQPPTSYNLTSFSLHFYLILPTFLLNFPAVPTFLLHFPLRPYYLFHLQIQLGFRICSKNYQSPSRPPSEPHHLAPTFLLLSLSRPYILTTFSHAPLQSACQQAANPTSAIPRLGPMCRHSRHKSPTAPQTLPVGRDCSTAAHPLAGQQEMSPSGIISCQPALLKTKPESRVKEDSGHT